MSENKWKKRIHYVLKAAKHFGDEPYMDFFLEREVNPLLLEFKQCWQRWYLQRDLV